MTSYYVMSAGTFDSPSVGTSLAIRAVTYELLISKINVLATSGGSTNITATRRESSTLSGGTAVTVAPLHQGAPAASATVRVGSSLAFSGTAKIISTGYIGPASSYSYPIELHNGATASVSIPVTLTIAPGSVLQVSASLNGYSTWCEVYFEEMRLAGSY